MVSITFDYQDEFNEQHTLTIADNTDFSKIDSFAMIQLSWELWKIEMALRGQYEQ